MKTIPEVWEELECCDDPFRRLDIIRAYGEQVKEECMKQVEISHGSLQQLLPIIRTIRDIKLP